MNKELYLSLNKTVLIPQIVFDINLAKLSFECGLQYK
jgi:hypothetical protein